MSQVKSAKNLDVASEWCQEARKILALPVLGKQGPAARALGNRSDKVKQALDGLSDVTDPTLQQKVQDEKAKFLQTSGEIHDLQLQYEAVAKRQKEVKQKSQAKKDDDALRKRLETEIEQRSNVLEQQGSRLDGLKNEAKQRVTTNKTNVGDKEWKKIEEGIKAWDKLHEETGKALDAFYAANNDGGALRTSYNQQKKPDTATVKTAAEVKTATDTLETCKSEIAKQTTAYTEAKTTYLEARKALLPLLDRAVELLPPPTLQPILDKYQAARAEGAVGNWVNAAREIDGLVGTIQALVDKPTTQQDLTAWEKQRAEIIQAVESEVSKMPPNFANDLRAKGGELLRLGDAEKKPQDRTALGTRSGELQKILAERNQNLADFRSRWSDLFKTVNAADTENKKNLALPLWVQGFDLVGEFEKESYVVAPSECAALQKKTKDTLDGLENDVNQVLADPTQMPKTLQDRVTAAAQKNFDHLAGECDRALVDFDGATGKDSPAYKAIYDDFARRRQQLAADFQNNLKTGQPFARKPLEDLTAEIRQKTEEAVGEVAKARPALEKKIKELLLQLSLALTGLEGSNLPAAYADKLSKDLSTIADQMKTDSLDLLQALDKRVDEIAAAMKKGSRSNDMEACESRLERAGNELKNKEIKKYQTATKVALKSKIADLKERLYNDGPTKLEPIKKELTELEGDVQKAKARAAIIHRLSKEFQGFETRLRTELPTRLKEIDAKAAVVIDRLPIYGKLNAAVANLNAETDAQVAMLEKKLKLLQEGLDALMGNDQALRDLLAEDAKTSDAEGAKRVDDSIHSEMYLDASRQATELVKKCKGQGSVKSDRRAIKDILSRAKKSYEAKNFSTAANEAGLALRLAKQLFDDPQGSATTHGGREVLQHLVRRWKRALEQVKEAFQKSHTEIDKAAAADTRQEVIAAAKKVKELVEARLGKFDAKAFNKEVAVLEREPPTDPSKQAANQATKKKYRELALRKVRGFRNLLLRDPVLKTLKGRNPWGTINYVPIIRALDDLNLHIQKIDE
jgi:hypothetical protein